LSSRFTAILYTALVAGALCAPAAAANVTLTMDPVHTTAEFAVQHLVISTVRGTIKVTKGDMVMDASSTVPKAASATLDATTVDSREPKRDENLRSPEFLDVAKYPTISFKSSRITPGDGKKFKIDGDLTLHGVTKPVTLDAEYVGQLKDTRGNIHMGYTAVTKIDRRDFGITSDRAVGSSLIAGYELNIILNVEAVRPAA